MKVKGFVTIVTLIILSLVSLNAAVVPGRWEKLETQAPNTVLIVVLQSGERITCFFKETASDSLTVVDPAGRERPIPKSEVSRVETSAEVSDSVVNGTLIGFGAGALGYLSVHAAIAPLETHDAAGAIIIGGIGALVGFLADKALENPEVLYISK
jgi:hypothetical protein